MSNQYRGKTAIISGGAGGICFALAKEFGQLGMQIVIADIDSIQLENALTPLNPCHFYQKFAIDLTMSALICY